MCVYAWHCKHKFLTLVSSFFFCRHFETFDREGLFGEDQDVQLVPDYYFNALIPLQEAEDEHAECGTEILLGSHRSGMEGLVDRRAVASGVCGDIIFFNGKCIHRGRPNTSQQRRDLVYVVYAAKWFEQGRDAEKEISSWGSVESPTGVSTIGLLQRKKGKL